MIIASSQRQLKTRKYFFLSDILWSISASGFLWNLAMYLTDTSAKSCYCCKGLRSIKIYFNFPLLLHISKEFQNADLKMILSKNAFTISSYDRAKWLV